MKVSTRLSLAEYFYTQGLLFLTLLQVMSLVRVTGPLSQALRLSSLKLLLTWRIIVCGQDMMLFKYVILRIHCVEDSLKLCFYFRCNSIVYWSVKPSTLLFCVRSVCYGCMNPTTYVWVTYRDP